MKIDRVIIAWDGNPIYAGLWDIQCKAWPKLGIRPTLAAVGDGVPHGLERDGADVVFLPDATELPRGQRNWRTTMSLAHVPRLFPDEVSMTIGLDQIPLGRWFQDYADTVEDLNGFIAGLPWAKYKVADCPVQYYPSSYLAASGRVWGRVMAKAPMDFLEMLRWAWNSGVPYGWADYMDGWGLDEALISTGIAAATGTVNLFTPPQEVCHQFQERRVCGRRLGRDATTADPELLRKGYYSEMHSCIPPAEDELEIIRVFLDS
ncbi:MAG: hypothetical protein WC718_00225 [Phycisphaerales bacterium]|jgi:hypothetical protein